MNHLIFGGAGFIGSHLSQYIKETAKSDKVFSFDIKDKVTDDYLFKDVRDTIDIDIPDIQNSIIYNLAAVHTTPGHPDHEYFETNILGAENICEFAEKNNIQTIVFTSSIAPYGPSESLKSEKTIPMPKSPYGISKLTAEYIFKVWQSADSVNRKLVIVRPGVVFGKNEGGNLTRLYESMKKGFFFYPGRRDTIKASVYVKDVVRILNHAGTTESEGQVTYNLTYSPAPTLEEICVAIAEVTGVSVPRVLVPGSALISAAGTAYFGARIFGKDINGIHPDRVKKLMISTNISGKKLQESPYKLQFSLKEALADWYSDCNQKGLY